MSSKSASAVIDRLRKIFEADNDTELCRAIDIGRQTLSNWKARESVPYTLCVRIAQEKAISLDWLLTGEGPMRRGGAPPEDELSPEEAAVLALFRDLDDGARREIQEVAKEKKRLRDLEDQYQELRAALADIKRSA